MEAEAGLDRADLATIGNTPEGRSAMEIAIEDETKFFDLANSAMWNAKERVFIDRR